LSADHDARAQEEVSLMDALKIVPQLFFDLIARVVPGSVAVMLLMFCGVESSWQELLQRTFLNSLYRDNIVGVTISALLLVAFVIGHMISPATKLVQRLNEAITNDISTQTSDSGWGWRLRFPLAWLYKLLQLKTKCRQQGVSDKYDTLRLEEPDVGALCAKIRAEFTMYNGLAAVFAISVVVLPLNTRPNAGWLFAMVALFIAAILMAYRGCETQITFKESVCRFHDALVKKQTRKGPHE
jgi:hypothetical protein